MVMRPEPWGLAVDALTAGEPTHDCWSSHRLAGPLLSPSRTSWPRSGT